ncbi:YARHG domain-containing protein [Crassaminicella thermophila]|uniref:YARHG domain-containing protein n=1 Tax=Crassaminicella thermophila TaxID=2599308 RepID=A0A5C0SBW3_CRATE|nr:YARHG domain-containing protein [Crassaminicella thermophila]QEK11412.1 YARHG domain-containing protein [Crassaminicella thermophila]
MKLKINGLIVVFLICIIFSSCSRNENTNTSSSKIVTTTITTSETAIDSKKKVEGDIILLLNNYEYNLNKPFEDNLLKNLNTNELSILRNSIFAKYGYIFSTQKYNDYFSQFSWYHPNSTDIQGKLNNIDKQNINKITTLEKKLTLLQFKSSKLGFSLTFPKSWEGKYRVEEYDMGITVYFKPKEQMKDMCGEFFSIINTESADLNENSYDTIGDKRYFEVNDIKYFIGRPTDFAFPEDHPESKVFYKMNLEVEEVLKTLKKLR